MIDRRITRIGIAAMVLGLLAGCGPENGRPRGGGAGADIGNHARGEIPKSKVLNEAGSESGRPPKDEQSEPTQ